MTFQEALNASFRAWNAPAREKLEQLSLEDIIEQAENKENWLIS